MRRRDNHFLTTHDLILMSFLCELHHIVTNSVCYDRVGHVVVTFSITLMRRFAGVISTRLVNVNLLWM